MKPLAVVILLAVCVVAPGYAQTIIYNDGPINGTTDAWTINSGFFVSDSFTVSTGPTGINELTFGAWLFPGDILESVQVSMTSQIDGGTTYFSQVLAFTQSGCSANQYGFNVCTETGFFNGPTLNNGSYWLNLQNAVVNSGDPVYWDENSGVGCTSPGCPSQGFDNSGSLPGESFTLYNNSGTVPEPGSLLLFGCGAVAAIASIRRKLRL
jgi:PEP-CTERM motif